MDSPVENIANSTHATTLKIGDHKFKPIYTYPIFGEAESILGFRNPEILLEFQPKSFLPLIEVKYDEKDEDDATDIVGTLKDFLPDDTATSRDEWNKHADFTDEIKKLLETEPFADLGDYRVFQTNIESIREFLRRIQIFVLLFIEAGSYIDETDDRWQIYLVFSRENDFVGFATVYPYFYYASAEEFEQAGPGTDNLIRERISQVVVLPPYQRHKIGSRVYQAVVESYMANPSVRQITTEDPNEGFDQMRELTDMGIFAKYDAYKQLPELPSRKQFEEVARVLKTEERHLRQVFELDTLKKHPEEPKLLKELIKTRLYEQNYDTFKEETITTQRESLESTYQKVIESYRQELKLPPRKEQGEPTTPPPKRAKLE